MGLTSCRLFTIARTVARRRSGPQRASASPRTGGNLSPDEYEGTTAGWQAVFDAMDTALTARF
ncbi:hypothetical protein [Cryobacterium sp.]|uniref:hypothetical protein n=1 Tax=Cryobacterium sp. TaxID=1926290 RepID=UPI002638B4BC|nr:hypothetical protein [Cryobacterium sp.]